MKKRGARVFAAFATVALSASASLPALADWDDAAPAASTAPEQSAQPAQPAAPQRRMSSNEMLFLPPDRLPPQQQDEPVQEKKFRMRMGPPRPGDPTGMSGIIIEEDTRGEAPDYQAGFGGPAGLVPETKQLAPLDASMIKLPQQRQPGSTMFEQSGSSGFFGGIKDVEGVRIDQNDLRGSQNVKPPAWAQDKLKNKHFYVEGQEYHGNEDPHGFF